MLCNYIGDQRSLEVIGEWIKGYRQKRFRIRRVFLKLRHLGGLDGWSDLVLLNAIVGALERQNLPYSKSEVYSTFKLVDKDDYPKEAKNSLIRELLKRSNKKSIF